MVDKTRIGQNNKKVIIGINKIVIFSTVIMGLSAFKFNDNTDLMISAGNLNEQPVISMEASLFPNKNNNNHVTDIVKNVSRSVVSINIAATNSTFFDQAIPTRGAGSGIIFKEDKDRVYIITNNHVVYGATNAKVSIDDNIQIPAHYIGSNFESDLAVIYFNKSDEILNGKTEYKLAKFGDCKDIEVGEQVVAIGNALGEGKTATIGIISATNKNINIEGLEINVLQTDAAINPGNSGGALANSKSEIIGINVAKLSHLGIEGMGYSIKASEALQIANDIINNKNIDKVKLGISGVNINEQMKDIFDLPAVGIFISEVAIGSSASLSKIKKGDIIVGFNTSKITTMEELKEKISNVEVGDTVDIFVFRDGNLPISVQVDMKGTYNSTNF
jgi:serine protease Do